MHIFCSIEIAIILQRVHRVLDASVIFMESTSRKWIFAILLNIFQQLSIESNESIDFFRAAILSMGGRVQNADVGQFCSVK